MNAEDRQRLARAIQGDRNALGALLERHGPDVERALTIGPKWRGAVDSGDVMQVTYLEAFLQIGRFDPQRAESFVGWLRRIAVNNLRDAIRALELPNGEPKRVFGIPHDGSHLGLLDMLAGSQSTPSARMRGDEARDVLHAAIDRLPQDYAQAVRLYDLECRSISQVAEALGRSPGAVHMLRLRAHDRLREILGPASRILDAHA